MKAFAHTKKSCTFALQLGNCSIIYERNNFLVLE